MSVAVDAPRPSGFLTRLMRGVINLILGTLFCLTPVTALIVLGWLMRRMRMVALRHAGLPYQPPGWILGAAGNGRIARVLGGFAANIREGVMAATALALATAPFTVTVRLRLFMS